MSYYKNLHCKDQGKIYNSIKKYGFENHKVTILFEGNITQDAIDELEIQYIKYYNSNSSKHLNICSGGKGHTGHKHSEESKEKMRIAKIGYSPPSRPFLEESKIKLSERLKEKYKDKTKHGRYDKVLSEETKQKIRDSLAKSRELKKYAKQINNDI